MKKQEIIVKNSEDLRIDKFITLKMMDKSRNFIQNLFYDKKITVNGKYIKASYKVKENDLIEIIIPEEKKQEILPEKIDLDIIYEDDYLAIINKPYDMVVHPTENMLEKTLVNGLLYKFKYLSSVDLPYRPGIVHRLDKDTTGLIIIAKDNNTHVLLQKMLKDREINKTYLAIVYGKIDNKIRIEKPIGRDYKDRKKMAVRTDNGKEAITNISPISYNDKYSLIEVNIETGRTHQIRVHLKSIHHEIVGDLVYGRKNKNIKFDKQLLHAYNLKFSHPITGKDMNIVSKPGDYFKNAILKLNLSINELVEEYIF